MRIEKHTDQICIYLNNNLIAVMTSGDWSNMISLPGTTVMVR